MAVLTIDIGNTSGKVAVLDAGKVLHQERRSASWRDLLNRLVSIYNINNVYMSSVGAPDPERDEAIAELNLPFRQISWDCPEVGQWLKNVPEGLGADRVAADIGARSLAPDAPLLVVDAGTCLTFDVIDRDGKILGGSISPGVELRLKSMHEHTALLPQVSPFGDAPAVANDTEHCMRGGAVNGVKWEIEGYVRLMQQRFGSELRVFSTGGNQFDFSPDVAEVIVVEPNLIHFGLASVFG